MSKVCFQRSKEAFSERSSFSHSLESLVTARIAWPQRIQRRLARYFLRFSVRITTTSPGPGRGAASQAWPRLCTHALHSLYCSVNKISRNTIIRVFWLVIYHLSGGQSLARLLHQQTRDELLARPRHCRELGDIEVVTASEMRR